MLPIAQTLLDRAHQGEKLTTAERRQCVAYLMATQPAMTNAEMGSLFSVSERTIRVDKKEFREEKAKLIRSEDVGLVVADLLIDFERQVNDIEKDKAKCRPGSKTYLDHCVAAMELRLKTVKALQDLGYYPKSLGHLVTEKYEYKAVVTKDGSVETRRVDLFDDDVVVDATTTAQKALQPSKEDTERRRALDEEFGIVVDEASPSNTI